jgi:hypothetical protein
MDATQAFEAAQHEANALHYRAGIAETLAAVPASGAAGTDLDAA